MKLVEVIFVQTVFPPDAPPKPPSNNMRMRQMKNSKLACRWQCEWALVSIQGVTLPSAQEIYRGLYILSNCIFLLFCSDFVCGLGISQGIFFEMATFVCKVFNS